MTIETTVYVFGGISPPRTSVPNVERLTMAENMHWQTMPTVETQNQILSLFGAVAISGHKIIVFGGKNIYNEKTTCSLMFDMI